MIWRVVVVVICIVIVVSAVWAASDSFEVRVDGPKTSDRTVIIPTPTPMPLPLDYSFSVKSNLNDQDVFYVDVSLSPTTHVVLMKGNREDELERFHLCRGRLSRCTGGIQSSKASYIDSKGDGIADILRVYFLWDDFKTLLSTTDTDSTDASSTESTNAGPTSAQDVTTSAATSGVPSPLVDPSTDRHRTIHLTLSGDLYAWKIAQP